MKDFIEALIKGFFPVTLGLVTAEQDRNEKIEIYPHKQACKQEITIFSLGERREGKRRRLAL